MATSMAKKPTSGSTAKNVSLTQVPKKDQLLQMYREMLTIRRFEEKAGQLYGMGLIGGFCHLYIGQEAVVIGMQHCITPEDAVLELQSKPTHNFLAFINVETGKVNVVHKLKDGKNYGLVEPEA